MNRSENTFLPITKIELLFFEESHSSPIFPSGKRNMQMEMSMEHCGMVVTRENRILGEKPVPLPLRPPRISHRLAWG